MVIEASALPGGLGPALYQESCLDRGSAHPHDQPTGERRRRKQGGGILMYKREIPWEKIVAACTVDLIGLVALAWLFRSFGIRLTLIQAVVISFVIRVITR